MPSRRQNQQEVALAREGGRWKVVEVQGEPVDAWWGGILLRRGLRQGHW